MNKKIGVYKITNTVSGKFYIGSSKNILRRWSQHRYNVNHKQSTMYQDMKELGLNKFEFTVLEECTVDVLTEREQYYINTLHPEYNTKKAYTGIDVSVNHIEDANAYNKEYCSKYYKIHKEAIKEYRRQYYKEHKSEENDRSIKYNQVHKDELKEYQRKYYETHKK